MYSKEVCGSVEFIQLLYLKAASSLAASNDVTALCIFVPRTSNSRRSSDMTLEQAVCMRIAACNESSRDVSSCSSSRLKQGGTWKICSWLRMVPCLCTLGPCRERLRLAHSVSIKCHVWYGFWAPFVLSILGLVPRNMIMTGRKHCSDPLCKVPIGSCASLLLSVPCRHCL